MNKPPGVNVSVQADYGAYNFTFSSGSLAVGQIHPSPSSAGWGDDSPTAGLSAMGAQLNWSFFSVRNVSQIGGVAGPCTQAYVAVWAGEAVQTCGGFVTVPLANNSSDVVEPHEWNGTGINIRGCLSTTPGAYAWFDTSYHPNATGPAAPVSWDLCGRSGNFPLVLHAPAEIPIVVSVPYDGREISATGYQTWVSTTGSPTANYSVPGDWNWTLAPVGPVSSPIDPSGDLTALVAFTRSAC